MSINIQLFSRHMEMFVIGEHDIFYGRQFSLINFNLYSSHSIIRRKLNNTNRLTLSRQVSEGSASSEVSTWKNTLPRWSTNHRVSRCWFRQDRLLSRNLKVFTDTIQFTFYFIKFVCTLNSEYFSGLCIGNKLVNSCVV